MRISLPREALRIVLLTALFALAAKLGEIFTSNGNLTPVWPPAAVACAAALIYGPRSLIGVALYIMYDYVAVDFSVVSRYAHALIEPLSMLLTASLVHTASRRLQLDLGLRTVRSCLGLIGIGVGYAATNAAFVTLGYCGWKHSQLCVTEGWFVHWLQAGLGDLFGLLICLPAMISWLLRLDTDARAALPQPASYRAAPLKVTRQQLIYIVSAYAASAWAGGTRVTPPCRSPDRFSLLAPAGLGRLALPALVRSLGHSGYRSDHHQLAANGPCTNRGGSRHPPRLHVSVPAQPVDTYLAGHRHHTTAA
jgi:hypothetical protein